MSEHLMISGLNGEKLIEVYNLQGEKVMSVMSNTAVNLKDLPDGAYVLRINGYKPVKVIKRNMAF